MKSLEKYKIDILNLSIGEHEYVFDFDNDFFRGYENSIIQKGSGEVKINLNKTETFIELGLNIVGNIELTCDRSLEMFDYPLDCNEKLLFKFGEEPDNREEDEIVFLHWNTQSINIGQYIYEFISVAVPMKKLHPRYKKSEEMSEDELIYTSENQIRADTNEEIDPRWQKLKELRKEKKIK